MTPQQKFDLLMSRQNKRFDWSSTYIPSTLAVPREAPKGSRISRLNSRKLNRTLHALSTPERVFMQLALYHPGLMDLHEQKMLTVYNHCHPLQGHPLLRGSLLPELTGTKEIAKQIGFKHHQITIEKRDGNRERHLYPYQGDIMLYVVDREGRPYALNWSVKDREGAFHERRLSSAKTPIQQRKDRDHAMLRGRLEKDYYASAGIRTVQVSLDKVESTVQANLDLLYPMHLLPLSHEPELLADYSCDVAASALAGDPVWPVTRKYGERWGKRDQFIARFYQDIWERKLPINFFKPILIDHALSIEGGDLLAAYSSWFEESDS